MYVSENSCQQEMQDPEDDSQEEGWTWNKKSVFLLLDCLEKNKYDLSNVKVKKKDLWRKIKDEMVKHGFKKVDESIVERKFRNMKATYKTIRNNRKKLSAPCRGEIRWDYYEAMDKIFENDKTFDNIHTISSIEDDSHASFKSSIKNTDNRTDNTPSENVNYVVIPKIELNNLNNTEDGYFYSTTQVPSNRPSHRATIEINIPSVSAEDTQRAVDSLKARNEDTQNGAQGKKKNERLKQLYGIRKKQLEFEKLRVKELQLLREAVEKSNTIQAERNDLLRLFLEKKS